MKTRSSNAETEASRFRPAKSPVKKRGWNFRRNSHTHKTAVVVSNGVQAQRNNPDEVDVYDRDSCPTSPGGTFRTPRKHHQLGLTSVRGVYAVYSPSDRRLKNSTYNMLSSVGVDGSKENLKNLEMCTVIDGKALQICPLYQGPKSRNAARDFGCSANVAATDLGLQAEKAREFEYNHLIAHSFTIDIARVLAHFFVQKNKCNDQASVNAEVKKAYPKLAEPARQEIVDIIIKAASEINTDNGRRSHGTPGHSMTIYNNIIQQVAAHSVDKKNLVLANAANNTAMMDVEALVRKYYEQGHAVRVTVCASVIDPITQLANGIQYTIEVPKVLHLQLNFNNPTSGDAPPKSFKKVIKLAENMAINKAPELYIFDPTDVAVQQAGFNTRLAEVTDTDSDTDTDSETKDTSSGFTFAQRR